MNVEFFRAAEETQAETHQPRREFFRCANHLKPECRQQESFSPCQDADGSAQPCDFGRYFPLRTAKTTFFLDSALVNNGLVAVFRFISTRRTSIYGRARPLTVMLVVALGNNMKPINWRKQILSCGSGLLLGLLVSLQTHANFAQTNVITRPAPGWISNGVVYELFPRQFSPAGNLNGITARLDELKDLGVNIIWLMPIHPISKKLRKGTLGSHDAARDYCAVNRDYGAKDDLKHLVAEANRRGLKIILDVVLLHTGRDSVMMAHPEYYKHDASGKIVSPMPEWTDVARLNYGNPDLRQYLISMLRDWLTETDTQEL